MSDEEDVEVYKVLTRYNVGVYSERPKAYVPRPQPEEYNRGYIMRFFAQKGNDRLGPIMEINEHTAKLFKDNPFYAIAVVSWKIAGPPNTIDRGGVEYEEGVSEHNFRCANLANDIISGIGDKLSDVYQFYKPS